MNLIDDPRAEQVGQLKLALATFALRLDAFEMRTHEVLLSVGKPVQRTDNRGPRKGDVIGGQ